MVSPKFSKEEPKVEEAKNEEPKKEEPEYMRILREHGYLESNIPLNNIYWRIRP